MGLHASTQLRAVKASDTNLTTKTGSRKAGCGFCIAKLSGMQWRECGWYYTYTQITHQINTVISLGPSCVLPCYKSYLHVKGHLRAILEFSAFPKRRDRALGIVSATHHTHHPKRANQSQEKKNATYVQSNKEQTIVFGSLILLFGFIWANISLFFVSSALKWSVRFKNNFNSIYGPCHFCTLLLKRLKKAPPDSARQAGHGELSPRRHSVI